MQCIFVDLPNWIEALAALGLVALTYLNPPRKAKT